MPLISFSAAGSRSPQASSSQSWVVICIHVFRVVLLCVATIFVVVALGLFLADQDLDGAAAWAGILGLFVTVVNGAGPPVAAWARQCGAARPAPTAVRRELPYDDAQFTGRAGELARLDDLLEDLLGERARARVAATEIVIVSGTAGVGKTALAVHWAHRVRHRFPDGDLYVDLRGHSDNAPVPVEAPEVLDRFLRTLDVPAEQIPPTRLTRTQRLLRRATSAVVADNGDEDGSCGAAPVRPGG